MKRFIGSCILAGIFTFTSSQTSTTMPGSVDNLTINNKLTVKTLEVTDDLVATVIPLKDTASNLASVIPSEGQIVYETDTKLPKIGDGITTVGNLKSIGNRIPVIHNINFMILTDTYDELKDAANETNRKFIAKGSYIMTANTLIEFNNVISADSDNNFIIMLLKTVGGPPPVLSGIIGDVSFPTITSESPVFKRCVYSRSWAVTVTADTDIYLYGGLEDSLANENGEVRVSVDLMFIPYEG